MGIRTRRITGRRDLPERLRLLTVAARRALALAALASVPACVLAADWMQFGYDAQHSGHNPDERIITRDNVAQLTLRWYLAADERFTSSPVYLRDVATPSGTRNLLFALGEFGSLYAIN